MVKENNTNDNTRKSSSSIIDVRSGLDVESQKQAITELSVLLAGPEIVNTSLNDFYMAVSYTVRDRLIQREHKTMNAVFEDRNLSPILFALPPSNIATVSDSSLPRALSEAYPIMIRLNLSQYKP